MANHTAATNRTGSQTADSAAVHAEKTNQPANAGDTSNVQTLTLPADALEAMQAQMAAMQAEIVTLKEREAAASPAQARVVRAAPPAKKVTVMLPKHKHMSDDVFVSVNGERYLIQRGARVEVPAYIAEALAHSEKQDQQTLELKEALQKKLDS